MKVLVKVLVISMLFLILGETIMDSSFSPLNYNFGSFDYGHKRVFNIGDSVVWSNKEYDAQKWDNSAINFDTSTVFWMREQFHLRPILGERNAIRLTMLASYDLFWDGVFVGKNGTVGANKRDEKEGSYSHVFILPDSLCTQGRHTLAIRASNFEVNNKIRVYSTVVGPAPELYTKPIVFTIFMHLLAGAFLIISIYYLFQYVEVRELTSLLFGGLCFAFLVLILFEYLKFYYNYLYSFHYERLRIIEIITSIIALLLPLFLNSRFKISKTKLILAVMTFGIFLIEVRIFSVGHDLRIMLLLAFSLTTSAIIAIWAYLKNLEGSEHVLISIIPCFLIYYYYDVLLFIAFFNLIAFNLFSLSKRQKKISEERNAALIQSARLELDLIKKSIQPHFLMNTLTSIIEWIEQDPKKSVLFVEALAEEFKILARISEKKLIPLKDELELCDLHLKIMEMRKGNEYTFDYSEVNIQDMIPPGVIHTIIENGISHSIVKDQLKFVLIEHLDDKKVCYKLSTIGVTIRQKEVKEGTGTKYIKARLIEAYGNKWSLVQEPIEQGWLIEITIFN